MTQAEAYMYDCGNEPSKPKTGRSIEDIKKLTDDQIDEFIAKSTGWKFQEGEPPTYGGSYKRKGWLNPSNEFCTYVPKFSTDLNAMHTAEKYFLNRGDEWYMYTDNLCDIITHNGGYQAAEMLIHASARTRAQAFVLTLEQTNA